MGVSTDSPDVSVIDLTGVREGMFFLSVIPGFWGRSVAGAQAFMRGGSLWTHSGIYTGDGRVVQAEPSGAKVREFPDRYTTGPVLWSDAPIQRHLAAHPDADEAELRRRVVDAALTLVDAPYAWLDYLTIGGAEMGVPGWQRLRRKVDAAGGLLCSALVDRAFALAGIHLFTDDRPLGQVTPADLARYDETWVRHRLADLEGRMAQVERRLDGRAA